MNRRPSGKFSEMCVHATSIPQRFLDSSQVPACDFSLEWTAELIIDTELALVTVQVKLGWLFSLHSVNY